MPSSLRRMHSLFCVPRAQRYEHKDDCRQCAYGSNHRSQPRPASADRDAGSAG